MERRYGDDFGFEIITEGSFVDEGLNISTIVIRLSCTAMNDWIITSIVNDRESYKTDTEWEEYQDIKEAERKAWERKILDKLQVKTIEGYCITQAVSEVFTVVIFEKEC